MFILTDDLENPNKIISIGDDDLQVCTLVMKAQADLTSHLKEMNIRRIIETVSGLSPFNKEYLEIFKDDPDKVSSFCYETILRLLTNPGVYKLKISSNTR